MCDDLPASLWSIGPGIADRLEAVARNRGTISRGGLGRNHLAPRQTHQTCVQQYDEPDLL